MYILEKLILKKKKSKKKKEKAVKFSFGVVAGAEGLVWVNFYS